MTEMTEGPQLLRKETMDEQEHPPQRLESSIISSSEQRNHQEASSSSLPPLTTTSTTWCTASTARSIPAEERQQQDLVPTSHPPPSTKSSATSSLFCKTDFHNTTRKSKHPKYDDTKEPCCTIVDALERNACDYPDHVPIRWVDKDGKVSNEITYHQLWNRSGAVANHLERKGIRKGDRVMIAYPFGLQFLEGLFACIRLGVVACSVYPPNPRKAKAEHSFAQFNNQAQDAGAKFALTSAKFKLAMLSAPFMVGKKTRIHWIATDRIKTPIHEASPTKLFLASKDIAFIQYTSGSTGTPKGVMISHGAIVHNFRTIEAVSVDKELKTPVGVSWLPQYHDYGLINFFLGPIYSSRFPVVCMSPIDFIENPLLWANVIEQFGGTHTAGPNFAYGLLARRMLTAKRRFENCKLVRANIAAEPIAPRTLKQMEEIGIPKHAINPTYGMSECCVYLTSILGEELRILNGVVSVGLIERSACYGNKIVIADTATKQALPDGTEGEIHISSPSLASGYWNQLELNKKHFNVLIQGHTYFATGDLGRIVEGRLYVTGRLKELIIINGRNVYPVDLESTIQDAYPSLVRPGSTVAYQWTATSVGIVLELRRDPEYEDELTPAVLRSLVQGCNDVQVGRIDILKKGTTPKTTSGKLRRGEVRRICKEEGWPQSSIVEHWRMPVNGTQTSEEDATEIPDNLPVDYLPAEAVAALRSIEANEVKLNSYFDKFKLDMLPEVVEAWEEEDKSTMAMQSVLEAVIGTVEAKHPCIVQFSHLLGARPDWLTIEDGQALINEVAHCGFVLEWITKKLASNMNLMQKKMEVDRQYEKVLLRDVPNVEVPGDARFLIDGMDNDPLFGCTSTFHWMKHRSIDSITSRLVDAALGKTLCDAIEGEECDWATLNVLEATWLDFSSGRLENASVGNWLCVRSTHEIEIGENSLVKVSFTEKQWTRVYLAWNLALMTSFIDPHLVLSKLLIPCVSNAPAELFFMYRVISLYLVSQQRLHEHVDGQSRPKVFKEAASSAFGTLNKKWVFGIKMDPAIDWVDPSKDAPPEKPTKKWLKRFSQWDSARPGARRASQNSDFDSIVSFFFADYNHDVSWEELGLTSLSAVEIRGAIADNFHVTLPSYCFERFPTPQSLKLHLCQSTGMMIPTVLPILSHDNSMLLSWSTIAILQGVGIMWLLFLFTASMVPAWYAANAASTIATSAIFSVNERFMKWLWLPLAVPTWMLVFSVSLILAKWIVIGRYKACQMRVSSLSYVRWWWMDRAVHVWEQWVGFFFMGTPLLWLMYKLMGAKIDPSVRIDVFLREFDLIDIEEGSWLKDMSSIKCRIFSAKPIQSIRFRPVYIGRHAVICGMVCPGSRVGEGSVVDIRAVMAEGSQAPQNSELAGNPATSRNRRHDREKMARWWLVYALSLVWGAFTLYMMFALNLVAQMALNGRFPEAWRYSSLFYWVCIIFLTALLILPVNVLMKWILIGRRKPGEFRESAWQVSCDWSIDLHYKIFVFFVHVPFKSWFSFWNVVLRLYGMDIDLKTQLGFPYALPPSKVDLVHMTRSYVSSADVRFETARDGQRMESKLLQSSISALALVGPGVKLTNSVLPPTEVAAQDVTGKTPQLPYSYSKLEQIEFFGWQVLWIGSVVLSFMPSYELATWMIRSWGPALSVTFFSLPLAIHVIFSGLVLVVFERLTFSDGTARVPKSIPLFNMCICASFVIQRSSFLSILWGTPFWSVLLRLGGATVGERVLFFGRHQEGMAYQALNDETIIDGAFIIGHNAVGSTYNLGPATVTGVLHEGTFIFANNRSRFDETGPWRCCIRSSIGKIGSQTLSQSWLGQPPDSLDIEAGIVISTEGDGSDEESVVL